MFLSEGNRDGSLLSDSEYAVRRSHLLKEKAALEETLDEAGEQVEQPLKLSQQVFEYACLVQERFEKGDAKTRKEILATMASNLFLKDKILKIEAKKPFVALENELMDEMRELPSIEPEKSVVKSGRNIPSILMCPSWLPDLDSNQDTQLQRLRSYH